MQRLMSCVPDCGCTDHSATGCGNDCQWLPRTAAGAGMRSMTRRGLFSLTAGAAVGVTAVGCSALGRSAKGQSIGGFSQDGGPVGTPIGDGSTSDTGPQPFQPTAERLEPGQTPPQFVIFSWDGAGELDNGL